MSIRAQLVGLQAEADDAAGDALSVIVRHHTQFQGYQVKADQEKELRNQAVQAAIRAGVTKYRIAKALGVAESTIGRIQ